MMMLYKNLYLDDIKNFYKETLFEIVAPSGKHLISEKTLKPFIIWETFFNMEL